MKDLVEMSIVLSVRPSDLLDLEGTYERYCFDEAATLYIRYLKDEKKPRFASDIKQNPTLELLKSGAL